MQFESVRRMGLASILAASLATVGCANMSDSDRRVGSGIGIGAATGALISGGEPGATAAGAVLGGVGGWLYDREKKKHYRYDRHGNRVYR